MCIPTIRELDSFLMSYSYAFVANPHVIYDGIFFNNFKIILKKIWLTFCGQSVHITVSDLMNSTRHDLFRKLCLPEQSLHHLLPPLIV